MANILVVDDDRNIRRMIAATFDTAGHRVIEADSAEQALKLFPESTADLVLSDVRMAGINGFGLLTELKRLNPALPVIMMTAFASIADAVEAMRHGAYDYIPKPFTTEHIRRVVARALELQSLRAENRSLRTRLERLSQPLPLADPGTPEPEARRTRGPGFRQRCHGAC